jgi:carboxyl-terminal processing protease
MTRRNKIIWIIVIVLGLGFSLFNLQGKLTSNSQAASDNTASGNNIYQDLKLFTEVLTLIEKHYVTEVDSKKLIYGALSGMTKSLDPYSEFEEPDLYKEVKIETTGEFSGLGIRIAVKDGYLTVITPMPGSPALKAGVLPGDKIIKIEGKDTKDITLLEAVKKLRGPKGTTVALTVAREGEKAPIEYKIVRDNIKMESVSYKMLESNIGYVRITEFTEKTGEDLEKALKELEKQKIESLVLDLRYNPGGLLGQAVDVSKKFIGGKKVIVSIEGRDKSVNAKFYADETTSHPAFPLVVLVNEGSASASEIVSGAIQDYKRGVLLGSKTFGKGSVQTIIPLSDGSGLRLTTAKYFTPSGRSIHEKGIIPDIVVDIPKESKEQMMKLLEDIPLKDDEKAIKDIQLERAVDILKSTRILIPQQG